jgi:uncharacterized protein (DUF2249 family)
MTLAAEIDVRTLPHATRHATIFRSFDALEPGEAITLVVDHEPRHLLQQLLTTRAGSFDWSWLEKGPERVRVEIRRRDADASRMVSELLEGDHQRLDRILGAVERLSAQGSFAEAQQRFGEFACGLDWHIAVEEEVLFPTVEQVMGNDGGPTRVMRAEHVEIRRLIGVLGETIAAHDARVISDAIRALAAVLGAHDSKEEGVLYPLADRIAADDQERDELVRRIQAF